MDYLMPFFDIYENNIENYEAFIALISLLPDSHKYSLILKILLYDDLISEGDLKQGTKPEGIIKIVPERKIITLEYNDKSLTLFHLPPIHEI